MNNFQNILFEWISDNFGIQIDSDKQEHISLIVNDLAAKMNISAEEYSMMLLKNGIDKQAFIEKLITPESYFLRYKNNMSYVINQVIPNLFKSCIKPAVLSVACARGEEPYSFAMMLQDTGIYPKNVSIVGIDISETCINTAKQGLYNVYSFRRVPKDFLGRHFIQKSQNFYEVMPDIKSSVQFFRLNIFDNISIHLSQKFHVIFCHNLFIYFNNASIERALIILDNLLEENGWLFVDSSEGGHVKSHFERVSIGNISGYRKKKHQTSIIVTHSKPIPHNNSIDICLDKKILPNISLLDVFPNSESAQNLVTYAYQMIKNAEDAYKAKQFEVALQIYKNVSLSYPDYFAQSLIGMATVYSDQGDLLEALECAETALKNDAQQKIRLSDQEKAKAYTIIILIMRQKGLFEEAFRYCVQLKQIVPNHPVCQ